MQPAAAGDPGDAPVPADSLPVVGPRPDGRRRVEHREYLHDSRTDPRRALATRWSSPWRGRDDRRLLGVRGAHHPRSGGSHPDLGAPLLEHVGQRFVDLLHLLHANYYHPRLRGSFSIKAVLPVVVDGMDYGDLLIRDGSQAALAFSAITDPDLPASEREELRAGLRAYCKRDTEAMMRLFLAFRDGA